MQNKKEYKKYAEKTARKSPLLRDCLLAFIIGGGICAVGQGFNTLYASFDLGRETVISLVPITMIFLGALFTALNLYERLAKYGGAGTIIPITGFANSIVSPAIEYKSEGLVLGLASKMFLVAGPVLVYGTVTSVIYGLIIYIWGLA